MPLTMRMGCTASVQSLSWTRLVLSAVPTGVRYGKTMRPKATRARFKIAMA